jgi:hypothetical protein
MKLTAPLALLLSLGGWVFLVLVFVNLLSGHLDDRTCGTECVRNYFFGATGLGAAGVLLALASLFKPGNRWICAAAVVSALPLAGIIAGIYLIGNFGHLLH